MSTVPGNPPSAQRYWVKNEHGRIWGPFGVDAIGRIDLGKGDFHSRIQVSTDGRIFTSIGNHPDLLRAIEKSVANAPPARRFSAADISRTEPTPAPAPVVSPSFFSEAVAPKAAPPPPDTKALLPDVGLLTECSTLDLCARVSAAAFTGSLTLEPEDGAWRVFFKKGTAHRVEAPQGAERLAKFLVRRNAAPPAQVQHALELSGGPDGEFVDAVVALNLVPPQDLFRLLGEFSVELYERVLSMDDGGFAWDEGVATPPGSFAIGEKWQLLSDWLRKQSGSVLRRRLGDRAFCAVYRSGGVGRVPLEALKLSAQETRVLAHFDGTRSADRIALDLPGETEVVLRTAYFLGELALLSFGPDLRDAKSIAAAPSMFEDIAAAVEKVSAHEEGRSASATGEGPALGKVAVKSVAVRVPPKVEPPPPPRSEPPPPPKAAPPKVEPPKVEPPKVEPQCPSGPRRPGRRRPSWPRPP